MEVETGEIKAITNMGRIREGVYGETKNHAVADEIEPGSTSRWPLSWWPWRMVYAIREIRSM